MAGLGDALHKATTTLGARRSRRDNIRPARAWLDQISVEIRASIFSARRLEALHCRKALPLRATSLSEGSQYRRDLAYTLCKAAARSKRAVPPTAAKSGATTMFDAVRSRRSLGG